MNRSPFALAEEEVFVALGTPHAVVIEAVLVASPLATGVVLPRAYPAYHHHEDRVSGNQALKMIQ